MTDGRNIGGESGNTTGVVKISVNTSELIVTPTALESFMTGGSVSIVTAMKVTKATEATEVTEATAATNHSARR
jgi:hypothetical protein